MSIVNFKKMVCVIYSTMYSHFTHIRLYCFVKSCSLSLQSVIYWQFKWNHKNQAEKGPYTLRMIILAAMTVKQCLFYLSALWDWTSSVLLREFRDALWIWCLHDTRSTVSSDGKAIQEYALRQGSSNLSFSLRKKTLRGESCELYIISNMTILLQFRCLGSGRFHVSERRVLCSPIPHYLIKNTEKYYYNFKQLFSMWMYVKL